MKTKTVHFKSGKSINVSYEIAAKLTEYIKSLMIGMCNSVQIFYDDKTNEVLYVINLLDIEFIE